MGTDVRWKGLDHEAIHKMINAGPGAAASGPQADFWGTLASGLNDISTRLHDKLGTLNAHWEGMSSEQALAGMSPLKDWAGTAENGSEVMKTSYELQGNYVAEARAGVPEPVPVTTPAPSAWDYAAAAAGVVTMNPGPALAVAAQASDHEAQERAQDEAARKAVETMTEYESSSDWNADTLGRFEEPPKVVVSTPPPIPNPNVNPVDHSALNNNSNFTGGTLSTTSTSSYQPIGTPTATPPQHTLPPNTPPTTTPPQHTILTPPQHTLPQQTLPPGQTRPPFTPPIPPGKNPNQPGNPGGFPPGGGPFPHGYRPGQGGIGGPDNATGRGPGGPGGSQGNFGGRGGIGGPGGGPGGANGGFGQHSSMDAERQLGQRGGPGGMPGEGMGRGGVGPSGNIGGGGGRGGAGGMGAPGARANGEEDEEHETPDYLLETEDVFGDERMVAPSVIGETREP